MNWHRASKCQNTECVEVGWDKASHSGAQNCVEVGTALGKSSHSESGGCVEAGPCACGSEVLVRDTKNRNGGTLAFSRQAWAAFLADIKEVYLDTEINLK
jgi:hypothetical protein